MQRALGRWTSRLDGGKGERATAAALWEEGGRPSAASGAGCEAAVLADRASQHHSLSLIIRTLHRDSAHAAGALAWSSRCHGGLRARSGLAPPPLPSRISHPTDLCRSVSLQRLHTPRSLGSLGSLPSHWCTLWPSRLPSFFVSAHRPCRLCRPPPSACTRTSPRRRMRPRTRPMAPTSMAALTSSKQSSNRLRRPVYLFPCLPAACPSRSAFTCPLDESSRSTNRPCSHPARHGPSPTCPYRTAPPRHLPVLCPCMRPKPQPASAQPPPASASMTPRNNWLLSAAQLRQMQP